MGIVNDTDGMANAVSGAAKTAGSAVNVLSKFAMVGEVFASALAAVQIVKAIEELLHEQSQWLNEGIEQLPDDDIEGNITKIQTAEKLNGHLDDLATLLKNRKTTPAQAG